MEINNVLSYYLIFYQNDFDSLIKFKQILRLFLFFYLYYYYTGFFTL